jgi:exodeoxyribonuclease VII small subunit
MAEVKFEKALERLEKIVDELESGSLDLDDSLKAYEEGVKLIKLCSKKLNEAEKKIEILTKEEGKLSTKPFSVEEE